MTIEPGTQSDEDLMRMLIQTVRWVRGAGPPPTVALDPAKATRFVDIAAAHRVLAALHPHAARLQQRIPEPVLAAAARDYRYNAAQQMLQRIELGRVLRVLAHQDVLVAPIKGLTLLDLLEQDGAARRVSDIDLLVAPTAFPRAIAALLQDGYQEVAPAMRGSHLNRGIGIELFHPAWTDNRIDLHNMVGLGHRTLTEQLLLRGTPSMLAGGPAVRLAPEDLLILLCLHLWKHGLSQLRWFIDIADTLIRFETQIDWRQVIRISSEARVATVVAITLLRTRDLLGVTLPGRAWQALHARPGHVALAHAVLRARRPQLMPFPRPGVLRFSEFAFQITAAGPDDRARARAIARALWPSRTTLAALNESEPDRLSARTPLGRLVRRATHIIPVRRRRAYLPWWNR